MSEKNNAPRWIVPLTQTTLDQAEQDAAVRVLRSGWLSMGAEVAAFEQEFAAAVGSPHAIAVANGTDALSCAYEAAGLRAGDVIAIPSLTFVAALNVALRMGLRPVLLDITSEFDLNASVRSLAGVLIAEPTLRAVVTMPYGGWSPAMAEIEALCSARGVMIIEDACHGLLGTLGGKALGTFGAAGTFSFFPNKNMTTGEGGMIVTPDADLAQRARRIRSHGMTTMTWDRERGHAADYDVEVAGENLRMDEMRAAIGRVQLAKVPSANAARRRISETIVSRLRMRTEGRLQFPFYDGPEGRHVDEVPAAHLLVGLLPRGCDRRKFREDLAARGVQTSMHYPPLYDFSHVRAMFEDQIDMLPVTREVAPRLVTLPLAPNFTDAQIDHLVDSVTTSLSCTTT